MLDDVAACFADRKLDLVIRRIRRIDAGSINEASTHNAGQQPKLRRLGGNLD
jgi:hypothetical protein